MLVSILAKLSSLDYKAAITVILITLDFAGRYVIRHFITPTYFDGLVGLAGGYWFGASD